MNEKRVDDRLYFEEETLEMEVDKQAYQIYNLSPTGFCVFSKSREAFRVGDVLSPIRIEFIEGWEAATGQVMHITPMKDITRKLWMVGIKFIFQKNNDEYFRKQFDDLSNTYGIGAEIETILKEEE